ncbi:hypothetical protein [Mycobacteroides abscessus]|uniref:hypothetical protein n=1 Tax=Mycobacteroides abscessus TaxID=36809 RepID=UPI001F3B7858|nr:hypothetical protein [Mycobacteroides abscessus]
MTAITWDRDDKADWGTVSGERRYMVRAGHLYYNHGGHDWRFIGSVIGDGHQLAETHLMIQRQWAPQRHLVAAPSAPEPTTDRRTLTVNGVTVTGEVQSISAHAWGDGSQSIEISFMPDDADDTVRVIESMRVDR